MIIIDLSALCYANVMAQYENLKDEDGELSTRNFKAMMLSSIKKNVAKFKPEFGNNIVIACDAKKSWRKEYFVYYKSNRKKDWSEESAINWHFVFDSLTEFKKDLHDYFPYRVIEVTGAEADDVIGALVHAKGVVLGDGAEKIMIVSRDKDFMQLQQYSNVYQWDPIKKKKLICENPELFLREHIIRGDGSDGIPNALSKDDTFVSSGRQTTLSAKRVAQLHEDIAVGECSEIGYFRNKMLIDLTNTPASIRINIHEDYESQSNKTRLKLMNYFIVNRLTNFIETLSEF